tara:strand:+ start:70086 stop:70793 length:708 start_codon:yes stop_codon:yes gene_type:complete
MIEFIGYVPARKGSKRLKNKNFLPFFGNKSLTEIALRKSNSSKYIKFTILDTDHDQFLEKMYEMNLTNYYFKRPEELSGDSIKTIQSLRYCINRSENELGIKIKNIVVLQPSSPLVSIESINTAISKYNQESLDLLVSFSELPININDCISTEKDTIIKKITKEYLASDNVLFESGGIYILSKDRLFNKPDPFNVESINSIFRIPLIEFVDVDYHSQFQLAKVLYNGTQIEKSDV